MKNRKFPEKGINYSLPFVIILGYFMLAIGKFSLIFVFEMFFLVCVNQNRKKRAKRRRKHLLRSLGEKEAQVQKR